MCVFFFVPFSFKVIQRCFTLVDVLCIYAVENLPNWFLIFYSTTQIGCYNLYNIHVFKFIDLITNFTFDGLDECVVSPCAHQLCVFASNIIMRNLVSSSKPSVSGWLLLILVKNRHYSGNIWSAFVLFSAYAGEAVHIFESQPKILCDVYFITVSSH